MWLKARDTLERIADLGAEMGVTFTLENLNPTDHPGCPFSSTADVLALVASVDREELRMNLDLYHTQLGEGDLIGWCRRCLPWTGEVQVADVPGRCETRDRRDQLPGHRARARRYGVSGPGRDGGLRGRRHECGPRRVPQGVHNLSRGGGRAPGPVNAIDARRCSSIALRAASGTVRGCPCRHGRTTGRSETVVGEHDFPDVVLEVDQE